jgi:hypothetical protein
VIIKNNLKVVTFEQSNNTTSNKDKSSVVRCFIEASQNKKESKAKERVYKAANNLNW